MSNSLRLTLFALLSVLTIQAFAKSPQEQNLKRKDIPEAIIKAFELSYPKAKVKGFSKETDEGKTVYELESTEGKVYRDILYSPDGTVVSIEESLPFAQLPKVVRDSLQQEFPKAKVIRCEKLTKGSTIQYEVVLKFRKAQYEVVFEPSGQIFKKEKV